MAQSPPRPSGLISATLTRACVISRALAASLALAIALAPAAASAPEASSAARAIAVQIDAAHPAALIPSDFLGLSFETSVLASPAVLTTSPALSALMRNLGAGVMRISGVSVDRTQWTGAPEAPAPWRFASVGPGDLRNLAALMAASGWRLLLGLNLGHLATGALVEEARAAQSILGGALDGLMIGNEPDLYGHPSSAPFRLLIGAGALRAPGWEADEYEREISQLRASLAAAGATAALFGPDTATRRWLESYADAQGGGLAALAQHFYPLDRCSGGRLLELGASRASLLSARVRRRELRDIGALMRVAVSHRLPLRIDEANSVACAGQPGVSDTFASALWAVDFSLLAAQRGVAGVNFHGGLGACTQGGIAAPWYSPLCALPGGQLRARPEYYALLLLRSLEGCAFVPASYAGARDASVYALRAPDGSLRVVIDDMQAQPRRSAHTRAPAPAWFELRAGSAFRSASVVSLSAPDAAAKAQVTLGGASVGPDGSFAAAAQAPLRATGGRLLVRVPAASVALVTLRA